MAKRFCKLVRRAGLALEGLGDIWIPVDLAVTGSMSSNECCQWPATVCRKTCLRLWCETFMERLPAKPKLMDKFPEGLAQFWALRCQIAACIRLFSVMINAGDHPC